ncbi:DEKNAAC101661 [Brettanomyces naardenensis]|uniref:Double-strand break repair protein n=1 Tax=Brettanomyces naardenensis TaxID=13370 RepID=A0A448YIY1_BRENA|nr:DEKNAAC101661 [Brettanomyces naardenensis]
MPQVDHIDPGPDTFRLLLTTDNHVGFMENDPIRGDDGWKTFSEIMHLAMEKDVDMVLQGGDLFHINQPSKKAYYHVIQTLRECCWSDKPIEFRLVSDPSNAMATKHFSYPAEYDNNVNVGIPVYAISGNHDDATGDELLSPLDLLSVGALLNHFGRVTNNDHISIYPLLFSKGSTNVAVYGLQNIRDDRLKKTMASGNLEFLQPDSDDSVNWFNIMCIHQNHVPRPGIRVVEEINLPSFLDFILWGHEHDCIPSAIKNPSTGFNVLQAGSSIATSLSEGELADKHVFILNVKGTDFSIEPIALKSVRPFAMKSIVLSETGLPATSTNKNEVLNFLIDMVEQLISDAANRWKENNKEEFESEELTDADIPLPLIRLRVEYSGGYEVENPRYFSNRFVGKVANVNDVLTLYRKRSAAKEMLTAMVKESRALSRSGAEGEVQEGNQTGESNIVGMIEKELDDNDLIIIRKDEFSTTLNDLVSKDNKSVLDDFVKDEEEKSLELLKKLTIDDDHDDGTKVSEGESKLTEVKKGFRNLAKRIRAEAKYATRALSKEPLQDSILVEASPPPSPEVKPLRKTRKRSRINPTPEESTILNSDSEEEYLDPEVAEASEAPPPSKTRNTRRQPEKRKKSITTRKTRASTKRAAPSSNGLSPSLFNGLGKRK